MLHRNGDCNRPGNNPALTTITADSTGIPRPNQTQHAQDDKRIATTADGMTRAHPRTSIEEPHASTRHNEAGATI